MSKHVLNTRLANCAAGGGERAETHWHHDDCRSDAAGTPMTAEQASRRPLDESDPLPPADRRTEVSWRSDIDDLYRSRAPHLIDHFTSVTRDEETASDLVHEAFARFASLSFARRLIVVRPDAYLYRVCLNLFRDQGRSEASQRKSLEREGPLTVSAHDPLRQLEERETLRRLEAAIHRLNPQTREVFLAKRLDGMSYAEIAARTGLSVKGVEKRMSKAIAAVDRAMERSR